MRRRSSRGFDEAAHDALAALTSPLPDVAAAVAAQKRLAAHVKFAPRPERISTVAGVDVAYVKTRGLNVAALVVMAFPTFEIQEVRTTSGPTPFPYIPGLLCFREAPLCYDLIKGARRAIDVLIVDGQGIAHPRRFGLACHLGVLTGIPTIGVAKSPLYGKVVGRLGLKRGARAPIMAAGERLGSALRTRTGVKPVYVSVGHRASLDWAEELVLALAPRYRLPEPQRHAHQIVTAAKKALSDESERVEDVNG